MAIDIRGILERFRGGAEGEAVFRNCWKMPGDLMSALTIAFRTEQDHRIRAFLIKVAGNVEIRKADRSSP